MKLLVWWNLRKPMEVSEYADKRMWDFHAEAMNFLDTYVEDKAIYNALKAYLDFVIERKV